MDTKGQAEGQVPTFDGLRLVVQYRMNRGEGGLLALMTGVSLAALKRFDETGEISDRDRMVLEMMQ